MPKPAPIHYDAASAEVRAVFDETNRLADGHPVSVDPAFEARTAHTCPVLNTPTACTSSSA
jgi:hypothetical protein